jgi:hypothetical protein
LNARLLAGRRDVLSRGTGRKGHIASAEHGRTGASCLLGDAHASFGEVFRMIGEVAGWRVSTRALSGWLSKPAGRTKRLLGYNPWPAPGLAPEAIEAVLQDLLNSKKGGTPEAQSCGERKHWRIAHSGKSGSLFRSGRSLLRRAGKSVEDSR